MATVPMSVATLCSTNYSLSTKKALPSRKMKGKNEMDVHHES